MVSYFILVSLSDLCCLKYTCVYIHKITYIYKDSEKCMEQYAEGDFRNDTKEWEEALEVEQNLLFLFPMQRKG